MERKKYSAGMVKMSFWFSEFRKMVHLLNDSRAMEDIKKLNLEENIFGASTARRAEQIFNTVAMRVKAVDQSFYPLFERCDIANQKIIVLAAIMRSDSLFFDFVYEVYREKLILGAGELAASDYSIFFKGKQQQSEIVAKWQDDTLKRLGSCYKTLLMEAGMTDRAKGTRKIWKPILDREVEDCLTANGMELTLRALQGVR